MQHKDSNMQKHVESMSCMTTVSRRNKFTTAVMKGRGAQCICGRQRAGSQAVTDTVDSVLSESKGRDPVLAICREN